MARETSVRLDQDGAIVTDSKPAPTRTRIPEWMEREADDYRLQLAQRRFRHLCGVIVACVLAGTVFVAIIQTVKFLDRPAAPSAQELPQ